MATSLGIVNRASLGGSVVGTSKPASGSTLRIADNAFLKCCRRCGFVYETATRRQPVMRLCDDCKFVLSPEERRGYMVRVSK